MPDGLRHVSVNDFRVPVRYLSYLTGEEWARAALQREPLAEQSVIQDGWLRSTAFVRLCLQNRRAANDEAWGGAPRSPMGTFCLVVAAATQGGNFADALSRAAEALRLLRPDLTVRVRNGRWALSFSVVGRTKCDAESEVCLEFFVLALHCAFRWLTDARLRPLCVRTAAESDGKPNSLLTILCCRIWQASSGLTIHYDPNDGALPLQSRRYGSWGSQEVPEFYKILQEAVDEYSDEPRTGERSIIKRVEQLLLNGERGEARIAALLSVSVASLRRHLAAAGTNYRTVLERFRRDHVGTMLQTTKSLSEIASEVGYSDVRALRRACVKWFGVTPSQLRLAGAGLARARDRN